MSNAFREAALRIHGNSWSDRLRRASLEAAEEKYFPSEADNALLAVRFEKVEEIAARSSYFVVKALQDATAKIGHIIIEPKSEIARSRKSDQRRATLIQRGVAGNTMYFGFPPAFACRKKACLRIILLLSISIYVIQLFGHW